MKLLVILVQDNKVPLLVQSPRQVIILIFVPIFCCSSFFQPISVTFSFFVFVTFDCEILKIKKNVSNVDS